jgi:hypothetical protein
MSFTASALRPVYVDVTGVCMRAKKVDDGSGTPSPSDSMYVWVIWSNLTLGSKVDVAKRAARGRGSRVAGEGVLSGSSV